MLMSDSLPVISPRGLMELIALASGGQMTVETFTELAFLLADNPQDAADAVCLILDQPNASHSLSSAKTTDETLFPVGSESLEEKWRTIVERWGQ